MAIVSISRIQVRRGRENQDGVPQLAGGELAWAVDTQKLYIGNGAVAEGAPAVGNTEILSTKTNLFDLADQYVYNKDSSVVTTGDPVISRTLQERLDENVSVRSFGANGDNAEQSDKIQYAIDQLFANTDKTVPSSRVTLKIPAGQYQLNKSIKLPPHTNIIGDGSDKTIFRQATLPITSTVNGTQYQIVTVGTTDFTTFGSADNNVGTVFTMTNTPGVGTGVVRPIAPIFETVNDTRTTSDAGTQDDPAQTSNLNQAREIKIEGMTLETSGDNIGLLLRDCANSEFRDLQIKSDWVSGTANSTNSIGIKVSTISNVVDVAQTNNNLFERVRIKGFSYALVSQFTDLMVDNIFSNCIIEMCRQGILIGEDPNGPNVGTHLQGPIGNKFLNTKFIDIDRTALIVFNGTQNTSSNNRFFDVGNDGNGDGSPVHAIIDFKSTGNKSDSDFFARTYALAIEPANGTEVYVPEITGKHSGTLAENLQPLDLTTNATITQWLKLPAEISRQYEISYVYKSSPSDNERTGTLTLFVDKDTNTVTLDDEFRYTGATPGNQPDPTFTAQLGLTGNNTVVLYYTHAIANETGTLNISIKSIH